MTLQQRIMEIQNSQELSEEQKAVKLEELYKEFDNTDKMFKDTQASFTKSQQDKIEMAKILVEQNPENVKKIPDEKVRNKIIQERWWVETLEQLEYIYPDFAKKLDDDWDDNETEVEKLKREVKFMKLQWINTKTKEAIEWTKKEHSEVIATIPDFDIKLSEELKSISEDIDPALRVQKAFRLVVNSNVSSADAFSIMQGITSWNIKTEKKEVKEDKTNSPLANAFKWALQG